MVARLADARRRAGRTVCRPGSLDDANVAALRRLLDADLFETFPDPAFYVYRLRSADHEQTGIVGEVPPQAFVDGRILGHEGVQPERVDALGLHLARLGARSTLVALMFRADEDIRKLVATTTRRGAAPSVRFGGPRTDASGASTIRGTAERIREHFDQPAALHHRRASPGDGLGRALGGRRPAGGRGVPAVLFPDEELRMLGVPSPRRRPASDVAWTSSSPGSASA